MLTWAVGAGHRESDPTAAAVAALPRQATRPKHHAAIPHAELAAALSKIRASGANTAAKLAVEFMALTATRAGEVRGAIWDEIDLDAAIWEIPEARTKTKTVHRVPLSNRAVEVLTHRGPNTRHRADRVSERGHGQGVAALVACSGAVRGRAHRRHSARAAIIVPDVVQRFGPTPRPC